MTGADKADAVRKSAFQSTTGMAAPGLVAAALLTVTALAWAGNYVLGRAIAGEVPPAGLGVARWLVAIAGLLPFAWPHLRRDWPAIKAQRGLMLMLGITGCAMFGTLQYAGMQFTTATNGSLMGATSPLMIAVAGAAMFRDRLSPRLWLGLALALAGVLVIVARGEAANLLGLRFNIGDLMVLAALAAWAVYSAWLRRKPAIHWTSFAVVTFAVGLVGNLPLAAAEHMGGWPLPLTWLTAASALYTGIASSLVGFAAWNRGVELIGSQKAGLYLYLIPVMTVLLSTVILAERLQPFHAIACVLILAGLSLAMSSGGKSSGGKSAGAGTRSPRPSA